MFTKLVPVVEKVDSTIRRIDSVSCLRKKLSDVLYEHQFITTLQKRVVRPTTPNIVGCYMLRTFAHPVAYSCVLWEFLLKAWNRPNFELRAGCDNWQEYWKLLTYPTYDDPLSNRFGTALFRYSSSVNRSSIRHGLSVGANTILCGVD